MWLKIIDVIGLSYDLFCFTCRPTSFETKFIELKVQVNLKSEMKEKFVQETQ